MTEPSKRRPLAGVLIVSVDDRKLLTLVCAILVVAVFGNAALSLLGIRTANRVSENSAAIAKQEGKDIRRSRHADARQCARENLVRAEVHVAYQTGQPMPPPEAFLSEPILRVLVNVARANQANGLKRVRRNLPILECQPNLRGEPAHPLTDKKQKRFVELYEAGLLDPTPSASDAQTGPDE